MKTIREAAEDALLFLDNIRVYEMRLDLIEKYPEIKEILRQALTQPEQEPVVGMFDEKLPDQNPPPWVRDYKPKQPEQEPVKYVDVFNVLTPTEVKTIASKPYTKPPKREWQNLTDDEIKEIVGPWGDTPIKGYTRKLFDQIEAKLKEKNT